MEGLLDGGSTKGRGGAVHVSRVTVPLRLLAERVLAHASRNQKPEKRQAPAAFAACEKLRLHLVTLMGTSGFRALLARACTLASVEAPWLSQLQVNPDGSLEWPDELADQIDRQQMTEGGVVLIALLLSLLLAFIGQNLTLRILQQVWPTLSIKDLHPDTDGENEAAE
jgi:hypothetical protein